LSPLIGDRLTPGNATVAGAPLQGGASMRVDLYARVWHCQLNVKNYTFVRL
jgi:hypothetical protein